MGLEAVVKRELLAMGAEEVRAHNGRVAFSGPGNFIARANLNLRSAERVHWILGQFPATEFEDLYQGVKAVDWGALIPEDGKFITEAKSQKSALFSLSDIQRIGERAIIDKLNERYHRSWYDKTGARYRVGFRLEEDVATVYLDTSGTGLHDRGYRKRSVAAPLTETMAAALVQLTFWKKSAPLVDPFCGSGTLLIEAVLRERNIAPGLNRTFDFQHWKEEVVDFGYAEERREAYAAIDYEGQLEIVGSDVDERAVKSARYNIEALGFEDDITILHKDIRDLRMGGDYGIILTNPPYGIRLEKAEVDRAERELGKFFASLPTWSLFAITSSKDLEKKVGKGANRKRKLYNGSIRVDYYQFYGPKPRR